VIALETRSYRLPAEVSLRIFPDQDRFLVKVRKHFLNPNEPWVRLFGAAFLQQLGRKLNAADVSLVAEAYRKAVEIIDEGVRFAEQQPLYLRIEEEIEQGGRTSRRQVLYLLGRYGFKIVAHGGKIRSAYFMTKSPRDSYFTLFKEAWGALRARALARRYFDSESDQAIVNVGVEFYNRQTWTDCPNPHRKPRRPRPARAVPR
jgi:hypothetical protein